MAGATARWLVLLLLVAVSAAAASGKHERWRRMSGRVGGQVVEKERRRVVAEAEAGTVTAVDVADAAGTVYRLHFITMDPGALFLPVQLHADMVFYVHSGRGKVTCIEEDSGEQTSLEVERGDVYNLEQGSIMFIQSYPNATRQRLRIYAIFTSEGINADDPSKPKVEAYSSVSNLLKGFQTEVLRLGFGVKREVAEAIKSAKTPPSIIPYNPQEKEEDHDKSNWTEDIVDALLGVRVPEFLNKKKKDKHEKKDKDKKSKSKAFNFYSGKPDVHNCYGWSRTMTNKDLDALHGSDIGMFMVNLTTGSMVGPHWNPKATEIAIVTDGTGIVQTVCPSSTSSDSSGERSRRGHHRGDERGRPGGRGDEEGKGKGQGVAKCRNSVFRVKEGDVFVVPRFHPMAQMSFNNDSFVFVGFSTHMGQNHPQFLAGKGSVLQAIGKEVLALSLGQENSTAAGKLLSAQRDSTILSCISCAEELEEKAAEEEERTREQEEKEKREREEEERKREREEKEKRERKEGERKREQEEREKREREEKEKTEREEEERKREEEERERKEEEEERQRRKEEERETREKEEKQRKEEEERARIEEEQRQREEGRQREEEERRREEEGGGRRGDEPEREEDEEGGDEPPPYRLSKKPKKRSRLGTFRSG